MDKKLLSRDSLNEILRSFEVLPDVHRATVWKAILNLPGNKEEYLTLRNAGRKFETNTDFADLQDENTRKLTRRVVRSVLAHSPSLVTLENFISNFVGAFSIALGSNELVYFEVILTILGTSNSSKKAILKLTFFCQLIFVSTGLVTARNPHTAYFQ
jgi:hypothetical protein